VHHYIQQFLTKDHALTYHNLSTGKGNKQNLSALLQFSCVTCITSLFRGKNKAKLEEISAFRLLAAKEAFLCKNADTVKRNNFVLAGQYN